MPDPPRSPPGENAALHSDVTYFPHISPAISLNFPEASYTLRSTSVLLHRDPTRSPTGWGTGRSRDPTLVPPPGHCSPCPATRQCPAPPTRRSGDDLRHPPST